MADRQPRDKQVVFTGSTGETITTHYPVTQADAEILARYATTHLGAPDVRIQDAKTRP